MTTPQPPLGDLLGASWALGSAVQVVAWSGSCAGFALADGTVALAPVPWAGAPTLRRRQEGGAEIVPGRSPPPLTRAAVSRGPCRALAGTGEGFLTGGEDGCLRHLARDGTAEKLVQLGGAVESVLAAGKGWACLAGGVVYRGPAPGDRLDLPRADAIAWHQTLGLAARHAGGVTLVRGDARDTLPGAEEGGGPLAFSPDGRWLATGASLWRLPSGTPVSLPSAPADPASLAFSRDGGCLALAGAGGVRFWHLGPDASSGGGGGDRPAVAVRFHPGRPVVAVAYDNGAVMLGPPGDRQGLLLRAASNDRITDLAFGPAGAWLAAGTEEGSCEIIALPELLFRDSTDSKHEEPVT